MEADSLLADLEPLTNSARIRRMVDLGRAAARGDEGARSTLAGLRASASVYARLLALDAAGAGRDGASVLAAVSDPSRSIRSRAVRLAPLACDDAQAGLALARIVERRSLRWLASALVKQKRPAPVDELLSRRLNQGRDPEATDLLPFGSEAAVTAHFKAIEGAGSPLTWMRLAVRHPAFTASTLTRELAGVTSLDPRQRYRILPVLEPIAKAAPDASLKLVKALFDCGEEPSMLAGVFRELVRRRPREAFDLLRARHENSRPVRPPGAFGIVRFDKVAHRLGPERLEYIITKAWSTLSDGKRAKRWFLRLSSDDQASVVRAFLKHGRGGFGAFLFRHIPADGPDAGDRERAYQRWSSAAQASDGTISPDTLDWLPRDLREREAKRHLLNCATLVTKPERRILYARLLPFAEAKAFLAPWLGHPEGEERARAQRVLLASVLHDPPAIHDALASIRARKNEQDPVRLAMIEALAALPVARFPSETLSAVGGVVQDALDAADLSNATSAAVQRLVVRLFRIDGPWGARWLARLLEVRGSVSTYGLGDGLTEPEVRTLSPALAELAATWSTRERASALINLAQSLGIRLNVVDPLLDALERLARDLPFAGVAAISIGLLKEHARPRFARLVPELIAEDRSFVLLSDVAAYVSRKRQDMLAPLLDSKPMTGRFASGRTHWIIDFGGGYGRWTATQQTRYSHGLLGLLQEDKREVPTARFAISTLVRLAFADASAVLPFAADKRPPVREIAVRALPWLDAGEGVPVLFDCLGDDRARYAIYALRKAFSEMPRAAVLEHLRAVPTSKVTVAKEVVRLLGELSGDDAYQDLLRLDRPGLHRDVRIALLRALWDHLEREETWAVFERASVDPDWVLASKLVDIPLGRLSAAAEERVVGLLAHILSRPEPEARLDLLKRAAYIPLRDERRALFKRLVEHMGADAPDEAAAALSAALHRMAASETSAISARIRALLSRRRHLVAFVPVVTSKLGAYSPERHVRVAEELATALRADPLAVPHYLEVAGRVFDWKRLAEALIDLAARDLLHSDAMVAAASAIKGCVHPEPLEERLAAERDPRLRRLAVKALKQAASPKHGWTKARRARLETYQKDPSPLVAGAASFLFPPD
jgi:hypothetical protein